MRRPFSFSNVTAGLALFVALGGTAVAAVDLPVDSVDSPQIVADAVRAPEIQSGAVRSSEILDESVKAADLAPEARTDLLGELRVVERQESELVATCNGTDVSACPDHIALRLAPGPAAKAEPVPGPASSTAKNWLVRADLEVVVRETPDFREIRCGLVTSSRTGRRAVLDEVRLEQVSEKLAFSAVVRKTERNPTVALRCTSRDDQERPESLTVGAVTMTAQEAAAVIAN